MSYEPHILDVPCSCVLTPRDILVMPVCQICGGTGVTVDWALDADGNLQLTQGLSKLQQDILKIMLSYVGSNELYPDYGCNVDQSIGQKNLGTHTRLKLQNDIIEAMNTLKRQQQLLKEKFNNLDQEEELNTIESVIVESVSETAYVILVVFTTAASATSSVATTIGSPVDKITRTETINRILGRDKKSQHNILGR